MCKEGICNMSLDINKMRAIQSNKIDKNLKEGNKWQYDGKAKTVLRNRQVLACILSCAIEELKGKPLDEIAALIENDIDVNIPVEPGKTNTYVQSDIHGLSNEDEAECEGKIIYDVKFYARLANNFTSQVIINIEAQRRSSLSYPLMNRAIFYASRLISSQKKIEFQKDEYNRIKPVYTIWLCMNRAEDCLSYARICNQAIYGNCDWEGSTDLINIIFIGLKNVQSDILEIPNGISNMHKALDAMFSCNLTDIERQNILKKYGVNLPDSIKEELNDMCGLGQSFYDDGQESKVKEVIKNLVLRGKDTEEEIAQIVNLPVEQVIQIEKELQIK